MSALTPHLVQSRDGLTRRRPPRGVRIRVFLHRGRLDRLLAEGVDPTCTPELSSRARQITRASYRRTLADSLDELLSVAEGRGPRVSAAPPLASRDIRACRAALLELSGALRDSSNVLPAGVALIQRLLTDGTGPLYLESHHDALWQALRSASAALHAHP